MKSIFSIVLAGLMFVGAGSIASADGLYVSVGGAASSDSRNSFLNDEIYGGNVAIGYGMSWLAVEAGYDYFGKVDGTTLQGYSAWVVADPVLFKVAGMPIKGIARVGYTGIQVASASIEDSGMAYGVGVGVGLASNLDLIVDYRVRNFDTSDFENIDMSSTGIGIKYTY